MAIIKETYVPKKVKRVRNTLSKEDSKIDDTNPMLIVYHKYLDMNYSNETTKRLYGLKAKNFLNSIYKKVSYEPVEMKQEYLDDYVIWLNSRKNTNAFYNGFIKSFRLAFDPDEQIFKLRTKLDRSRTRSGYEEYDWLSKEDVDKLIEKGSSYLSTVISIYFDTALRLREVILIDLENEEYDLNLTERYIKTIGKGNSVIKSHFSKRTAKKIYDWIRSPMCIVKTTPFLPTKRKGTAYNNPFSALDYKLKQESHLLGIQTTNGKAPHIHCMRHSKARYLADEKKWKIEQIAAKLNHRNINNTRKYVLPDAAQIREKEDTEVFD